MAGTVDNMPISDRPVVAKQRQKELVSWIAQSPPSTELGLSQTSVRRIIRQEKSAVGRSQALPTT